VLAISWMHPEWQFDRILAARNGGQRGKATTAGVRSIHGRVLVAAAALGALILFGPVAHAECGRGAACLAKSREVPSTTPKPTPPPRDTVMASPPLLATGIVLTSLGTLALVAAGGLTFDRVAGCMSTEGYQYSGDPCPVNQWVAPAVVSGAVFVAVGIPLMVLGARHRPRRQLWQPTASVAPWLGPHTAGVGFRLEI
jgi:hypothetical protein